MNIATHKAVAVVPRSLLSSARCQIPGCTAKKSSAAVACDECFATLPEGVQWVLRGSNGHRPDYKGLSGRWLWLALSSRLACRFQGPPSDGELAQADALLPKHHAVQTMSELVATKDSYFPKFCLADMGNDDARREILFLSDVYDRAQIARGDSRRAIRLGWCGL